MARGRKPTRTVEENFKLGNPRKLKKPAAKLPVSPPKEIEDLAGSDTKDGANGNDIAMPSWMKGTAAEVWEETTEIFAASGYLSAIDKYLLVQFCAATGIALDAQQRLAESPQIAIKNANNTHSPSPDLKIAREAWAEARKVAKDLGITPPERKRAGLVLNGRSLDRGDGKTSGGTEGKEPGVPLTAAQQRVLGLRKGS